MSQQGEALCARTDRPSGLSACAAIRDDGRYVRHTQAALSYPHTTNVSLSANIFAPAPKERPMQFPEKSASREEITSRLDDAISRDADWRGGKIFSLVYFAGDDVADVLKEAYTTAFYTNGLGPGAFKSLKKFESEVISMTGDLLRHPEAAGNMTSGGTESILMGVKTARDWARAEKGTANHRMVVPVTAHPAFDKAAHYLDV